MSQPDLLRIGIEFLVFGIFGAVFWLRTERAMRRKDEHEDKQSEKIQKLQERLHQCELKIATMEEGFVRRGELDGRVMRIEDGLKELEKSLNERLDRLATRLHERLDLIGLKLGVDADES